MGAEGQDMSVLRSLPALGVEDSTRLSVLPEAPNSLPGWKEVVLQGRSPEEHCWASDTTLASAASIWSTYQKALQVEKPAPRRGRLTARPSGKFWIPIPMAKFLKDREGM